MDTPDLTSETGKRFRNAVRLTASLNLGYFGIEFAVALLIGSVALFADSIDFLEDSMVGLLVLMALGWSAVWRARAGMAMAAILLIPTAATLIAAWHKLMLPVPPAPVPLTLAGLGALAVNLSCAFILARHRNSGGSLSKAAFLSARNDALANIAIILAAFVTAWTHSAWPDLIVGIGIGLLNLDAAREVWSAAHQEHRDARA